MAASTSVTQKLSKLLLTIKMAIPVLLKSANSAPFLTLPGLALTSLLPQMLSLPPAA
jgi:hypothetical protein